MRLKLQDAFKIPRQALRPEQEQLLRSCAGYIRARGLGYAASVLVEGSRPVHFLGASACRFAQPLLEPAFFRRGSFSKVARLLENPSAADRLLELLCEREG